MAQGSETLQTRPRKEGALDSSVEQEKLAQLVSRIKAIQSEIGTFQSGALSHARTAGEALKETKRSCRLLKIGWSEWVEETLAMTRQTANQYVRIFRNWDKLEHLEAPDRSIAGAIRFLRGSTRSESSKTVVIQSRELLATAEKTGLPSANAVQLQQFVNEVLRLVKISKTLSLVTQK